jgi:lipopolysaccharide/colanic/teichoic acid biosynthesis glycosyltransferase|tara:strand:- start:245 stop:922 length:678 start_codon:yes stop_codon:yes gene_type:complete
MQRFFDIIFSIFAIVLFSPLLLPLMLILRFTGEGEIFFLQNRVGRANKIFKLYKFATMLKDSPNIGSGTVTLRNDPRILPLGGFLRKTKINELPQLINILIGDMSIIGPRPQTQRCFNAFSLSSQHEIIKVRPGLSGIGSIIFRNEEDMMDANNDPDRFYDEVVMTYKGALEKWYVTNQNIMTYFGLILATIWSVLRPSSSFIWLLFNNLPKPPDELKNALNYND